MTVRFRIRSLERAQQLAKEMKRLLAQAGREASLTQCQSALAGCYGYATWAEMRLEAGRDPSPLDEDAGQEAWKARISRQCDVIAERFEVAPAVAAGVAKALRPSGRERSADREADLTAFLPWPRTLREAGPGGGTAGGVKVFLIQWEESEAGWGVRPDGYTVHASEAGARAFVKAYWDRMPDRVPEEYSRPCSDVVALEVPPDHAVAARLAGKGEGWLTREEERAVSAIWPRDVAGWHSLRGGGSGYR